LKLAVYITRNSGIKVVCIAAPQPLPDEKKKSLQDLSYVSSLSEKEFDGGKPERKPF
jgi:hypothetical protein